MNKLEVGKKGLWVVAVAYLVYTIVMLLPMFAHIYTLALLGENSAVNYEQVRAIELLGFIWLATTVFLPAIGASASQFIAVK